MSEIVCPECDDNFDSERGMKIHRTKTHGEWKEHKCPTCGDCFETLRGMKCHHSHKHGESISGESVECSYCGDTLRKKRNVVEEQDLFFCDESDCMSSYYEEKIPKEEHGSWDGGKVELFCDWCSGPIERRESEVSYYDNNFCGNDCRFEWWSKNCPTGEDNPNWCGGYSGNYGSNWNEKRREILERDEFSCKVCGMSRDEHYSEYDEDLHVHHKIPIATFDEPEDANYLTNLITSCQGCHPKLDVISRNHRERRLEVAAS